MHMLFMLHPLIHVLMVAVLAFFVLFAASKAEGFVSLLGTVLGWVILLGAAAMLVLGILCHLTDKCPMEHGDKKVMMWESDGNGPPPAGMMAAPAPQTAPAQPAASPPKP